MFFGPATRPLSNSQIKSYFLALKLLWNNLFTQINTKLTHCKANSTEKKSDPNRIFKLVVESLKWKNYCCKNNVKTCGLLYIAYYKRQENWLKMWGSGGNPPLVRRCVAGIWKISRAISWNISRSLGLTIFCFRTCPHNILMGEPKSGISLGLELSIEQYIFRTVVNRRKVTSLKCVEFYWLSKRLFFLLD